jgi:hypothetical protein
LGAKWLSFTTALFLLVSSLSLTTLPSHAQVPGTNPTGGDIPHIPENPYGVNVFLHKEVEAWKIEETLRMIAAANIPWIKQEFPWQEIEFKKGYFHDDKWNKSSWDKFDLIVDLAERYGLAITARISHPPDWAKAAPGGDSPLNDYQDLADFTNALLDHYEGRIKYIQMWNEPNLSAEWVPGKPVDPAGYAELLKAVYPAVKDAHPDAVILSAPMAITLEGPELRGNMNELDYWEGLYEAGVKDYFDIVSANAYGLDQPPEAEPGPDVLNFRRVELLREIVEQQDEDATPIWFNEYAWNASPETLSEEERNYWRHVTPEQQAEWTVAGVEYARNNWPWAGVVNIWYFRQVGDIPPDKAEYYFAMVDPAFIPQPVYNSVKVNAANYPGPASQEMPERQYPQPTPTGGPPPTETLTPPPAETPGGTVVTPEVIGTPLTDPTATPSAAEPTPTATATPPVAGADGGTLALYIIGGLLVVGGLVGLGYYFMRKTPAQG